MSKRRIAIWIGLLAFTLLLGSLSQIYRICLMGRAEALMEAGEYIQAGMIYRDLGNESGLLNCEALQRESEYQAGLRLLQEGSWGEAIRALEPLAGYSDTAELLEACAWQEALAEENTESLLKAHSVFLKLGSRHPGCQAALDNISPFLFSQAEALASAFRLEEACLIWQELGNYDISSKLLQRGRRALDWSSAPPEQRLLVPENRYLPEKLDNVYLCEQAYIVVPERCGEQTEFFVYYPGGRNEELSLDYLLYYMMNPAPDTMAVFMRRNGLDNMRDKTCETIELLERAAAECGLFVDDIVTAGSSLGAYPAMHSVGYAYEEYGIKTDCVLSLDAGSDWMEAELLLSEEQCRETAELGTEFYLFESPWVGMNRDGIRLMVNTGNKVTMVGCVFDDHVRISLDALGMGVVAWAIGDRSSPCNPDIYDFTPLSPEDEAEKPTYITPVYSAAE